MRIGFSIDPRQGLAEADELRLVELGARLGYDSAWTPSGPDEAAFDRCLRWHAASGLPTGISVVPASGPLMTATRTPCAAGPGAELVRTVLMLSTS